MLTNRLSTLLAKWKSEAHATYLVVIIVLFYSVWKFQNHHHRHLQNPKLRLQLVL